MGLAIMVGYIEVVFSYHVYKPSGRRKTGIEEEEEEERGR